VDRKLDHENSDRQVIRGSADDGETGCGPHRPEVATRATFRGSSPNHPGTGGQSRREAHSGVDQSPPLGRVDLESIMQRHARFLGRRSVENRTDTY
jgi:hypothetical protein